MNACSSKLQIFVQYYGSHVGYYEYCTEGVCMINEGIDKVFVFKADYLAFYIGYGHTEFAFTLRDDLVWEFKGFRLPYCRVLLLFNEKFKLVHSELQDFEWYTMPMSTEHHRKEVLALILTLITSRTR